MKEVTAPATDVGVIMARFQCHELHEAHKDLIQTVIDKHDRVFIFLGVAPIPNTLHNPLDFRHRKAMIEEAFPTVEVYYQEDTESDFVWSINLDRNIRRFLNPMQTATLYGSRDSFLKYYNGTFPTKELQQEVFISGTQIRKKIINNYPSSKDFRAGLIAATGLRYPTAFQCVDVAIFNELRDKVLLVRKPGKKEWQFLGGFSDPVHDSLEEDVRAETMQEAKIEIGDIRYISSHKIANWRYRSGPDRIKTAFFAATYVFGRPEGADDVEEAKWFVVKDLNKDIIIPEHHILLDSLLKYVNV